MQVLDNDIGPVCEAVVQTSDRITPETTDEVRRMTLRIDDPAFRFSEGQSIGVVVPGPHPFGNKYHLRRYSIASKREAASNGDGISFDLLVRRCFYIDDVSGERFPGIASNYLCDARPGDRITISGPYRSPFNIPEDRTSNLLMIGTGTGIAPFRGFIQRIYDREGGWDGKIRLFYGARTGMDLVYTNDEVDDFANYYDEKTFRAYKALVSKPLMTSSRALELGLKDNSGEVWDLINKPNTHVFIAGLDKIATVLDRVLADMAGSEQEWKTMKKRLIDAGRWSELIYG